MFWFVRIIFLTLQPTGLLVAAAKKAVPVVGEETVAVHLGNMAKYTATRLGELRSAIAKVRDRQCMYC